MRRGCVPDCEACTSPYALHLSVEDCVCRWGQRVHRPLQLASRTRLQRHARPWRKAEKTAQNQLSRPLLLRNPPLLSHSPSALCQEPSRSAFRQVMRLTLHILPLVHPFLDCLCRLVVDQVNVITLLCISKLHWCFCFDLFHTVCACVFSRNF